MEPIRQGIGIKIEMEAGCIAVGKLREKSGDIRPQNSGDIDRHGIAVDHQSDLQCSLIVHRPTVNGDAVPYGRAAGRGLQLSERL